MEFLPAESRAVQPIRFTMVVWRKNAPIDKNLSHFALVCSDGALTAERAEYAKETSSAVPVDWRSCRGRTS